MKKEYVENSMFLCNYKSLQLFVDEFIKHYKNDLNTQWSIVCERKEDLVTIRNQVLFEIEKRLFDNKTNTKSFFGISMYTLDNLARNFCASLSSTSSLKIKNEIPKFISLPYLDVINQELLIENILKLYGYNSNDSLPIAKQILSLIDINWPEDYSFAKLLISTQNKENIKTVQEINEIALRQILGSFQYGTYELANYSRLQSLVKDYLQGIFIDHLSEYSDKIVLPYQFLNGNILWISAPELLNELPIIAESKKDYNSCNTIKPGNFQSFYVDEFKKSILKARNILNINNLFISSRTILKEAQNEIELKHDHISYYISENRHCFSENSKNILNDQNTFCILADFDPGKFKESQPDAAGNYQITKQMISNWEMNNTNYTDAKEIFPQIDNLFEKFIEQLSLIGNEKKLNEIGKIYDLDVKQKNDEFIKHLFYKSIENEKIQIGKPHPISLYPKALSYFSTNKLPQKIVSIGRAHAPTGSSFHVKVLNNAISILRKQGISIDLPASEIMYRGFWKNIANLGIPLEFWLENLSEINDFPKYLIPKKNIFKFGISFPESSESHLIELLTQKTENNNNIFPIWNEYLIQCNYKISITSFEKYVNCPLQFLLQDVLGIKQNDNSILKTDHLEIGSKMHLIAEQFITRIVTTLGNSNYSKTMLPIYEDIIFNLKNENIFLSNNKSDWIKIFCNAIEKHGFLFEVFLKEASIEAIDNLWNINKNNEKSKFILIQEREILKRTFYRFIQIEKKFAEDIDEKLTGIERERPISLSLGGLVFSGKIDRIDATQFGLRIIDYKTSNIPKTEKKLSILPSELIEMKSSKLSVQGALYCLAWSQTKLVEEDDLFRNQIRSFSLYHLKNLDEKANPILNYEFGGDGLKKDNIHYQKLYNEYLVYANNLKSGNFYPKPIKKNTCEFCDFKSICPISKKQNDEDNTDNNTN
ncbi:hypothetical protein GCL60_01860 [Silvanigrella paludirubra]|uniref:PD-(D/E)XK endonuclease-like domain-containing protein n=1 Tax=Silvanigrella paludirubra TaxID=2499159 RepID=A0A6N6VX94_9BACT|nr:PD-(D/E)XK nuclease family protein [Silvanigrella paludirubra]KAB8040694.1 hypothetical protein GCL60_01860 [Silvanigrella paludirubra]